MTSSNLDPHHRTKPCEGLQHLTGPFVAGGQVDPRFMQSEVLREPLSDVVEVAGVDCRGKAQEMRFE
jgi:hypothetical protein